MNNDGFRWANEREMALFRAAVFDALCQHPRIGAVFYYAARNEDETWDDRFHNFNTRPIRFDGSHFVTRYANGIQNPASLVYTAAIDFVFPVYGAP